MKFLLNKIKKNLYYIILNGNDSKKKCNFSPTADSTPDAKENDLDGILDEEPEDGPDASEPFLNFLMKNYCQEKGNLNDEHLDQKKQI